jgi:hypothetical protein
VDAYRKRLFFQVNIGVDYAADEGIFRRRSGEARPPLQQQRYPQRESHPRRFGMVFCACAWRRNKRKAAEKDSRARGKKV